MNWLAVAGVVTVTYGVAIEMTLGWEKTGSFLVDTAKLNEVGDFLAGVFAPIALIWLVAAVLTQRQELNETREQFEKSQDVIDAQLQMIKVQNVQSAEEHKLAVENAKKAYKLSLFTKRFEIYEKFVAFEDAHDPDKPFANREYDEESYRTMILLCHEASFVYDRAVSDWFGDIAQQIDEYMRFKAFHPLEYGDDGYGNMIEMNNAHNSQTRTLYKVRRDMIRDQFTPVLRIGKLGRYLNVSDEPDV